MPLEIERVDNSQGLSRYETSRLTALTRGLNLNSGSGQVPNLITAERLCRSFTRIIKFVPNILTSKEIRRQEDFTKKERLGLLLTNVNAFFI